MIQAILTFFERYAFGVCTYIGEKFQVSSNRIRLFFIYSSFLAVGTPLVFYFLAALVLDIRKYFKPERSRIIDEI
jgi:phage shock protein C